MKLEEFVTETLSQIVGGVKKAQDITKNKNAVIAPYQFTDGKVDFDVAVTVIDGKEANGKASISVWSIGAGLSGKLESSTSTVSHIKFSINMKLPQGDETPDYNIPSHTG